MSTSKPRVFVTQIPARYDRTTSGWIPKVDIAPAREFGEVIVMLPSGMNYSNIDDMYEQMSDHLDSFWYTDYLLLMGDPLAMAVAAARAGKICIEYNAALKLLKWDRVLHRYLDFEVTL
jgi:hypothetical protein